MSVNDWYLALGIGVSVLVILGGLAKFWPHWSSFWTRLNGTLDAIAGREAFTDPASGKQVDALPPLTTRMASVEQAVVEMKDLMKQQVDFDRRLSDAERRIGDHDAAIAAIAAGHLGQLERIVTRAESAQAWRAIADSRGTDDD